MARHFTVRRTIWQFVGICLAGGGSISMGSDPPLLSVGMSSATFSADEGCQWVPVSDGIRGNSPQRPLLCGAATRRRLGDVAPIAPRPPHGRPHSTERPDCRRDRHAVRRRAGVDAVGASSWAWSIDLAPSEELRLRGEARWLEGNERLCLAFDWLDRTAGPDGTWQGWSTVVGTATLKREAGWHPFEITVKVPLFDPATQWARPILGMDGTFDKTPGRIVLRNLEWRAATNDLREKRRAELRATLPARFEFDDSIYRREDQQWMTRNFVCGFLFAYDRAFWDPDKMEYRIGPLCGGRDSRVRRL